MLQKLQPFMKAVAPAFLTLVAVGTQWLVNGTFDRQTGAIAITGLAASIVTYLVPKAPVPPVQVQVKAPVKTSSK